MQKIDDSIFYDFCIVLFKQEKLIAQEEPQNIHNTLNLLIKKYFSGDTSNHYTQDMIYLMVALADEFFLNTDWQGKKYWEENMLEYAFFKTQIAGDIIFAKIDEAIENKNTPIEIAKIYLYALSFGFLGKYRGLNEKETYINEKKKELYNFIEKSTKTIYRPNYRIFSEQYAYTLPTIPRKLLPDSNKLLYICLLFIFIFFVFSSIVWIFETKDFFNIINDISSIALRE